MTMQSTLHNFTAISLFSGGIDGLGIAASVAGFRVTHHVEWDSWCCKVLRKNFPHSVVIEDDIHNVRTITVADVLLGSPPCQGWSAAGNGLGESDPRNLWPDMLRLVQQSRPRCVLVENVRGGISKGYIDLVCGGLEAAGYEAQALVYPAAVVGAPHIRERVFIVAHAHRLRQSESRTQQESSGDFNGFNSPPEQSRRPEFHAAVAGGEDVQHAASQRSSGIDTLAERGQAGKSDRRRDTNQDVFDSSSTGLHQSIQADGWQDTTEAGTGLDNRPERSSAVRQSAGLCQSRMVGGHDGTAAGLDSIVRFDYFPNYMGLPQHAHEPPRTISKKVPHHADRIKASGNSVVWRQAYPLMRGIMRWLEANT